MNCPHCGMSVLETPKIDAGACAQPTNYLFGRPIELKPTAWQFTNIAAGAAGCVPSLMVHLAKL